MVIWKGETINLRGLRFIPHASVIPSSHGLVFRLVFNCFQAGEEAYDPQYHTAEKAKEDAETIYQKGQGKFLGTDEKKIFKIEQNFLASHSDSHHLEVPQQGSPKNIHT